MSYHDSIATAQLKGHIFDVRRDAEFEEFVEEPAREIAGRLPFCPRARSFGPDVDRIWDFDLGCLVVPSCAVIGHRYDRKMKKVLELVHKSKDVKIIDGFAVMQESQIKDKLQKLVEKYR